MTIAADAKLRPAANADYRAPSKHRRRGILLALIGLVIALIAFVGNLIAAAQAGDAQASTLALTFGVTTTGFAVMKTAIAVVLWGILAKLWLRAESIKASLPALVGNLGADDAPLGEVDSPYGKVRVTEKAPEQLPIHKMAKRMFRPMVAMGLIFVVVGLLVSLLWAGSPSSTAASAWTQGLQFLGEAMLLSGISFLLGTILWAIRTAGGEVQEGLGVAVHTPKMPGAAKAFIVIMIIGLIAGIVQFLGYVVVAGSADPTVAFTWLGPLREAALGLILTGIALALVAIGNVLGYQFHRVQQLIATGGRSSR